MHRIEFDRLNISHKGRRFDISYFIRHGSEDAVLYLHGLGSSKKDFIDAIAAEALSKNTLVSFDFPGCGDSSYDRRMTLGMADLVEIAHSVVSQLELRKVHVIGHSMGGLVGLLYADTYQEYVTSFVNVEGNLDPEDCRVLSRFVVETNIQTFSNRNFAKLVDRFSQSSDKGDNAFAKLFVNDISFPAFADYSSSIVDYSDGKDLLSMFLKLKMPKLFIYGVSNNDLPYIPLLKEKGIMVEEIPDCGHFPVYSNISFFYDALRKFKGTVSAAVV